MGKLYTLMKVLLRAPSPFHSEAMLIYINRISNLIMQNFCIFLNKFPQFAGKRWTGNLRLMHSPYFSVYGLGHRLCVDQLVELSQNIV